MSGFAAVAPTRPANSVLGGYATSSAPAFPSSCAAATAAAAALRGRGYVDSCDTSLPWGYHLQEIVLYYSCSIGLSQQIVYMHTYANITSPLLFVL